jgi:hypothetical protein
MSADINGQGLILIGPKGTNKTELFFGILKDPRIRLHSNDIVFVRYSGSSPTTDSAERKLFLPTNTVEAFPRLAPLLDNSKCENVIIRKGDCRNEDCLRLDDCRLDRGSPFCYKASKQAQALLDPYWIEGASKHVKRTSLRWVFILRYDTNSPPSVEIESEDAIRILESGENIGLKKSLGSPSKQPFFNPHLLLSTSERIDLQKHFFERLFKYATCYLFNSGVASEKEIIRIVAGEESSQNSE